YAREISRKIQAFRKELGLKKTDLVNLVIFTDDNFKKTLEKQKDFIKDRTNSKKIEILKEELKDVTGKERFKNVCNFEIKDKRGKVAISLK
ncbi:MAG: DUF5915 domain-containing protein, partial [Nanoarchaeota archaeon]